jgi:hypothetical protein
MMASLEFQDNSCWSVRYLSGTPSGADPAQRCRRDALDEEARTLCVGAQQLLHKEYERVSPEDRRPRGYRPHERAINGACAPSMR